MKNSRCLFIEKEDSKVVRSLKDIALGELGDDEVQIQVQYSSVNYKDALCATGHPGVARKMPMVPGIDAAGIVVASNSPAVGVGQEVMVFHADFGTLADGGISQVIHVPADWVYTLPSGMTAKQSMIYGTAGYTAAQSVEQLLSHGLTPDSGRLVVTGATGGVGVVAIAILNKLGFKVDAITGKRDRHQLLKSIGASEVFDRDEITGAPERPMLKGRWAGAVDTVGGSALSNVLRFIQPHGCVTACGMVGGHELETTVYPFILRGVVLAGIDSAGISREHRARLWEKLAGPFAVELGELVTEISLSEVTDVMDKLLASQHCGRSIVKLSD